MKTLILFALMMVSGVASAGIHEPSLFTNMATCTAYAVKTAEYAAYASNIDPKHINVFYTIVKHDVDAVASPGTKRILASLGTIAWNNRTRDPGSVAMTVYTRCFRDTQHQA